VMNRMWLPAPTTDRTRFSRMAKPVSVGVNGRDSDVGAARQGAQVLAEGVAPPSRRERAAVAGGDTSARRGDAAGGHVRGAENVDGFIQGANGLARHTTAGGT
jgi:hypothetical protein